MYEKRLQNFELPEDIKKKIEKTPYPYVVDEVTLFLTNAPVKNIENLFRNTPAGVPYSQPYQAIRRSNYV